MRLYPAFLAAVGAVVRRCGTSRHLPPMSAPLARTDLEQVRTTAYTHTESDHEQYGNRTALGGVLHAAPPPAVPRAIPVTRTDHRPYRGRVSADRLHFAVAAVSREQLSSQIYGSAAADWARWPAGTIFRVLSTGQLYRVEDYGWALSGRNTIDLYMATPRDMNKLGRAPRADPGRAMGRSGGKPAPARAAHQYRHIKRMVLELEGHERPRQV